MKKISIIMLTLAIFANSCQHFPSGIELNARDVFTTENLPSSQFEIDGDADTIVTGKNGTKIFIPQQTFIGADGRVCSGHVSVELKEAITPADMVIGNMITMSNGKILQSGGMVYINARQNDQPLAIATGKSVTVSVPAKMKSDSMQIYSATYDSSSRQFNWINPEDRMIRIVKSDTLEFSSAYDSVKPFAVKQKIKSEGDVVSPTKPDQLSNRDTILSLIFDTATFPELSQYRNVKFKLLKGSDYRANDSETIWNGMQLEKTEKEGIYLLTFSGFDKSGNDLTRKYKVSPVFSGTEYATAMKEYNQKFESYEQKKKEIEENRIKAEREARLAREAAEREQLLIRERAFAEFRKQQMEAKSSGINSFAVDQSVNYVFALNKLGWANIDRLYGESTARPVDFQTLITDEELYESIYISLLFDQEKIYLPGYQKKDHSFCFSHNDKEKMVLPVGSSAVVMATAYKNGELHFVSRRITVTEKMNIVLTPQPIKQEELSEMILKNI